MNYKISIIGAGNVGFRLAIALQQAGHSIVGIYSRDIEKAEQAARAVKRHKGSPIPTNSLEELAESDVTIIAVTDSAIASVAAQLSAREGVIAHTSGAENIKTLQEAGLQNYGVFYPLMTISKVKEVDMKLIPFLLEAQNKEVEQVLINLACSLKAEYSIFSSEKRLKMHTAAVFTTNYINYMLSLAYEISSPDFVYLLPSAVESVRKAFLTSPKLALTGPARRHNHQTMQKHISLLESSNMQEHAEIYKMIAGNIMERYPLEDVGDCGSSPQ